MSETTQTTIYTVYDLEDLRQAKAKALHVCQEAWHIAETHTVEEGYPYEQWRAAVEQAEEAQRVYEAIWAMYDAAKTQAINAIEDAPIDYSPLGGW